jgi:hypothetical protein
VPRDGRRGHRPEREYEGHHRLVVVDRPRHPGVVRGQFAPIHEILDQGLIATDGGPGLCGRRGGVGVAPIDAGIVAHGLEHRLLLGSHTQHLQRDHLGRRLKRPCRSVAADSPRPRRGPRPLDLLLGLVDRQLRAGAVVDRHIMGSAVDAVHLPGKVAQRSGEHVQVVRQRGRHERQRDVDPGALELVDATRGKNFQADLRQGGQIRWIVAHQPVRPAIDANQAHQRVGPPGPVAGDVVGEPIGARPDAEVRVAGHQWHGRRSQQHVLGDGPGGVAWQNPEACGRRDGDRCGENECWEPCHEAVTCECLNLTPATWLRSRPGENERRL